tara:strand:+ start:676 stop:2505 length:1830 start_codon:yes stop_codon:yes gene_type:complete
LKNLLKYFHDLTIHPKNAAELKGLILQLAVQGKLTAQWRLENPDVEPASVSFERAQKEKTQLIKNKTLKKEKALPVVQRKELINGIPETWKPCRFGDIGDWGAGATPSRSRSDFYGGDINWFKSGELNNGIMDYDSNEKINALALQNSSLRLNKVGDVLIAMYGATIGKTGILAVEGATNQAVCACTPFSCIGNIYLHLLLKAYKGVFIDQGEGGAQPNISRVKIRTQVFALPPLEEQKAIVSVVNQLFAEVEQLEALTKERIRLKEDFVTSALQQLTNSEKINGEWAFLQQHFSTFFTELPNIKKLRESILQLAVQGKLTAHWRKENPDIEDVNIEDLEALRKTYQAESVRKKGQKNFKYKKSVTIDVGGKSKGIDSLFDIPSTWEWVSLGQVSWSINDGPHFSPRYVEEGVPMISGRNITFEKGIDFTTAKNVSEDDHIEFTKRGRPEIGDVLLTKGGTTGIPCVVETSKEFSVWVHVALIKMIKEYVDPYFLKKALASPFVYRQSQEQTHGIGNKDLGLTRMIYFAIPLPPLSEQKAIVEKVNTLMALCDQLEQEIQTSQNTRKDWMKSSLREVFAETKPTTKTTAMNLDGGELGMVAEPESKYNR